MKKTLTETKRFTLQEERISMYVVNYHKNGLSYGEQFCQEEAVEEFVNELVNDPECTDVRVLKMISMIYG